MNRMLIIDDEHHIVNWLYDLFTSLDNPELEVMKAYSGFETMTILKRYKIDLMLLDISMPGMSGFDVAKKTLEEWPATRIVFLTAHDNFEYIYQVNQLPNTSYLLKTEDDKTIIDTVNKALVSIQKEQEIHNIIQIADAREMLINHLTQQEILRLLVHGTSPLSKNELLLLRQKNIPLRFENKIYLLYTQIPGNMIHRASSKINEKIITNLLTYTVKYLHDNFIFSMLELRRDCFIWFLEENRIQENALGMPSVTFLENFSEDMVTVIETITNKSIINILYSSPVNSNNIRYISNKMNEICEKIIQKNSQNASFCTQITETDIEIANENEQSLYHSLNSLHPEDLSFYLTQKDRDSYLLLLDKISSFCKKGFSMHDLNIIQVYNDIASSLIRYINQHGLEKRIALKIAVYPLYYMQDFQNWQEAFQYIQSIAGYLFDLISDTENDRNELLLSTVETYVFDNISKPLTLSEVASAVNYNSTYISRLYKKVRGISLPKFILQSRIELAEKLLLTTDDSIQNIARESGFDTSQYFSIVFKKETGYTPRDYRQSLKFSTPIKRLSNPDKI